MRSLTAASTERLWYVAALLAALLGWALFGAAAVVASVYTVSHAFRGYEWTGGFLMTLALFGFCAWPTLVRPGLSSPDERSAARIAVNLRIGCVLLLLVAGAATGAMIAAVEWFVPPTCVQRNQQETRGFHTSPSPSPAPKHTCETDPVTGTLLLAQLALLGVAAGCMWLASTAAERRVRRGDIDDDDEDENATL
jgi:hypothetical protein